MRYCLSLAICICSLALFSQETKTPPKAHASMELSMKAEIPIDPRLRSGVLANGLTYYIQHNEKPEDRAELRLAVHAGSIQEDEDQLGLAHFVEHMAFNGSEHFDKNELIDYLESVGTRFGPDLNAYTSFDETVYMLQVRTDDEEHLAKGLTVLQDWAGGVAFDDEEIDKERGVVVSEWRTRLSANQRMQQQYFPVMFHNSRYAERLPIGDPEIVEHADYATVKRFYQDWYRPNLMAVIIIGDVDVDAIEQEIKDRFSGLQNPEQPRPRDTYPVPDHEETLFSICSDHEATFTNVRIMYKHDDEKTRTTGDYRRDLVQLLYNRMLNARLYELNSQADPPFVYAYSGYGGSVGDLATYTSFAMVPEGGTMRAFETLLTENQRVLQHGFVPSELDRQKEEMMRSARQGVKEQDKSESRRYASQYVGHFLDESPVPGPENTLKLYEALLPGITVAEINALARQWIIDENRVIVVTGPDKEDVPLPTEEELAEVLTRTDTMSVQAYVDDVSDAPLFDEELSAAVIESDELIDSALDVHMFVLSNGVHVMYKQTDFKNDEILMGAYSLGGHSLYDDDAYQSARAMMSIMRESGLADFTAPQLEKMLAGTRVNVNPFVSERYEGFNGSCSAEDLELLFQLVYLYSMEPRFDEEGLQAYIKKQEAIYSNLLSNPENYFREQMNRIRYGNHPRRVFPKPEDLQNVDLTEVTNIYRERFLDMDDFTFFFTGSFDPDELRKLSAIYLGSLPSTDREETWADIGIEYPEGQIDTAFVRGEAPKSVVQAVYQGEFDWNTENVFNFRAMIEYLRIQLRETLREDMGGVYGVSIYGGPSKNPPRYSIMMSFNADPPRANELLQAAHDVLEKARNGDISEEDLQKVRETQKQSRIKDLKENRFWQSGMVDSWVNESDLQEMTLESLEQRLEQLTAEDIHKAAQMYLSPDNRIEAVLHPQTFDRS